MVALHMFHVTTALSAAKPRTAQVSSKDCNLPQYLKYLRYLVALKTSFLATSYTEIHAPTGGATRISRSCRRSCSTQTVQAQTVLQMSPLLHRGGACMYHNEWPAGDKKWLTLLTNKAIYKPRIDLQNAATPRTVSS